ncbi:MAG: T9SS type A sorting domain-containing protein, partial [Flavobacteriales bacterium]|nr:T9SS type A sorting domain-containing protein [Flavobacteriales bacterium]
TLTSNSTADVFVAKYDNNGNYVWAFNIGSNGADGAKNMSIGNDGFLYVTGNFNGTVDFNPGVGVNQLTTPNTHAFLAKYDGLGNYVWGINIGDQSASISNVYGISNNVNNEIVISGSYLNSIDVDPSIGTDTLFANGNHDVFVVVYSKIGTLIKATSLGSTGFDFGYATDLSNSGKIFIGGAFQNTVDFDPGVGIVNLSTSIGYDAFSAQYGMPPCSLPDLPSISSLNNPICFGDSATLSIISGNLNDASNWYWYSSTCGGTFLGVGNTISVMPLSATDYFVRGEGNCVASSNCSSITVNVNSLPSVSIDVFNPNTICLNSSAINLPIGSPMGGVYSGLGVNGSNFDPAISGVGTFFTTYTYTDANSCSNSDSTEITVNTCVGIENNASIDEVVIAPNPFTNQINFIGLSKKETIINIVDIHGRTVLNHSTNDINTSISTENLSLGSFFVRIISENNVIVRKIVKQ